MPYVTQSGSPEVSILKMDHVVFDEISFTRKGFQDKTTKKISMKVGTTVENTGDHSYHVNLTIAVEKEKEYDAVVSVSGFCSIEDDSDLGKELIEKNAVAILFPYVRAELSLLTAQPETDPIVLPAMNINGLMDGLKKEE